MKKTSVFIIVIALCLTVLLGCTRGASADARKEIFCRVVCEKEDGIIVYTGFIIQGNKQIEYDCGYVYVKNINTDLDIDIFDTVVIKFSKADLIPATGEFLELGYAEQTYSYILENPKSIRFADSAKGEPTYG